jgi:CRISPR-associated protein Cas4
MKSGEFSHKEFEKYSKRIKFKKRFNIENIEKREYEIFLKDEEKKLSGKIDILIKTKESLIPIEIKKNSVKNLDGIKFQLLFYIFLVRNSYKDEKSNFGYIYFLDTKKVIKVNFDKTSELFLLKIIENIKKIKKYGDIFYKKDQRCLACEYKNLCY